MFMFLKCIYMYEKFEIFFDSGILYVYMDFYICNSIDS